MIRRIVLLLCLFICACLEVAHLASFLPNQKGVIQVNNGIVEQMQNRPAELTTKPASETPPIATTTAAQFNLTTNVGSQATVTTVPTTIEPSTSTTQDPNADPDDPIQPSVPPNDQPDAATNQTPNGPVTETPNDNGTNKNLTQPNDLDEASQFNNLGANQELTVLFYSVFIVYISFTKLIYHNVGFIKYTLTEPGILMIFGIIWELISRQLTTSYDVFPRFNSRIFFYLFLPSTVLEAASVLSNKWLFINLLPILIHSIIGTLCYASALAFTIYSLTRHSVFNFNTQDQLQLPSSPILDVNTLYGEQSRIIEISNLSAGAAARQDYWMGGVDSTLDKSFVADLGATIELANLTVADCLVFGTILSSVDSSTLLGVLRSFHFDEKLYYLTVGEGLMNNAVVLVIFNLLLEFFNATRLTVVKIYFAIIQFFITLIGSIFIGLALASIALISVRLTKKLQMPNVLSSYSNQCQAMVETLLILKLAYLAYTVASIAGTSSILSLTTFGILHDQYIKHNLNLRSQLTYKQVILATRLMGFSLVYPLLGMLLVDVSNSSQFFQSWNPSHTSSIDGRGSGGAGGGAVSGGSSGVGGGGGGGDTGALLKVSSASSSRLGHLAKQVNTYWNFKFLSMITLFSLVFRFAVVISLSMISNLFSSNQLKIKFKEQILLAYGGLKGPLAFALVHRLIEHEEFRNRTMRNKHLFMYTILTVTFLSTIIKGSFMRLLVSKMRLTLDRPLDGSQIRKSNSFIVFNEINCKVTEYITHGLNSVLGRRKSPYDRFLELNEIRIKPWLARDSSNTNWLSVFYDNLILDETLNANCFYRSAEQILPVVTVMQQTRVDNNKTTRKPPSARRLQGTVLDTIAENRMLARNSRESRVSLADSDGSPRIIGPFSRRLKNNYEDSVKDFNRLNSGGDKPLLKEFVMFNLKLEDARRRKQSTLGGFAKVGPTSSADDNSLSLKAMRMLSTTSSDELEPQTTSPTEIKRMTRGDRGIKRRHGRARVRKL